jgi:hypothetical protein
MKWAQEERRRDPANDGGCPTRTRAGSAPWAAGILSYLNIGESMKRGRQAGHDWNEKIKSQLVQLQNQDGTGRTSLHHRARIGDRRGDPHFDSGPATLMRRRDFLLGGGLLE